MIKSILKLLLIFTFVIACKKEIQTLPSQQTSKKTLPITGLVIAETTASMNQMTADNDAHTQTINENL